MSNISLLNIYNEITIKIQQQKEEKIERKIRRIFNLGLQIITNLLIKEEQNKKTRNLSLFKP